MRFTSNKNINIKKLEKIAGLAFENGIRLHFDSILLFKNNSYPTAFYISVLALEEIGKAFFVENRWWHSSVYGRYTPKEEEKWFEQIYSHKEKQLKFIQFVADIKSKDKIFQALQNGTLDIFKQNSVYVGLNKQGRNIIIESKIINPLKITDNNAKKIITFLNDKLIELCIFHYNGSIIADTELITKQFNQNLYEKLTTKWPYISRKIKSRMNQIN